MNHVSDKLSVYDPLQDLTVIFNSPASLSELPDLLTYTNKYKLQLDKDINNEITQYNDFQKQKNFSTASLTSDLCNLVTEINDTKQKASKTEATVTSMTINIKKLDEGKKNLVLSMTVLKRLQMLITANDKLQELIPSRNYSEISNLISVVIELINHFKTYKSIDDIAKLTQMVSKTQKLLIDDIFEDFELIVSSNRYNDQLLHACQILESFGQSYKDKLINWYCDNQLKEINDIFKSSDEAGSLENLNRRFIFFKRVLNNSIENHKDYFPKEWKIENELTSKFCESTKADLKNVLNVYKNSKNSDVNVLLQALQESLDFESFLNGELRTTVFEQKISGSFEPYLYIWISKQDEILKSKFLDFLSSPKIPVEISNPGESGISNVPNITPSSADLFRTYRNLLTQTSKLSKGSSLLELTKLFDKWLKEYSVKIISPLLPNEANLLSANNESLKYLTLILNTADYCSSTSTQLEEKIKEIISPELRDKISFDEVKEIFIHLIAQSISLLLTKISKDLDFVWREFQNSNWENIEQVGDVSRYEGDLEKVIKDNLKIILPLIIRDGYIRNFCDKVVELVFNSLVNNMVKIKPISIICAEQLLLDLQAIKKFLLKIVTLADPEKDFDEAKVSNLFTKLVNTQATKVEKLLKLFLTPLDPMEGLVTNYFVLIGDISITNFNKILDLRGIDRSQRGKLNDLFNVHLNAHEETLIENSPILANLSTHPTSTQQGQSNSYGATSLISPKSLNDSIFSANVNLLPNNKNLNINNLEKSIKELAFNGENKFNENFKSFGKLFRRDNNNNNSYSNNSTNNTNNINNINNYTNNRNNSKGESNSFD